MNKQVKIGLAMLVVIIVLGGIGYEAYQHDVIPGMHKTINIPSSYEKIKVGVDTAFVTDEELARIQNNITPPVNALDKNGLPDLPQLTLLTPFLLKDGDQIGYRESG